MQNSLIFIVDNLSDLYIAMFLMRFILQWVRGGYQTVLSQFVMKVTAPLVIPARRVLPSVRGVDVPTLVVLVALECIATLAAVPDRRVSAAARSIRRLRGAAAREPHALGLLGRDPHLCDARAGSCRAITRSPTRSAR